MPFRFTGQGVSQNLTVRSSPAGSSTIARIVDENFVIFKGRLAQQPNPLGMSPRASCTLSIVGPAAGVKNIQLQEQTCTADDASTRTKAGLSYGKCERVAERRASSEQEVLCWWCGVHCAVLEPSDDPRDNRRAVLDDEAC